MQVQFVCCPSVRHDWYGAMQCPVSQTCTVRDTVQNSVVPELIPYRVPCRATDVYQFASYNVLTVMPSTCAAGLGAVPDSVPRRDPPVMQITVTCDVYQCCGSSCGAGLRAVQRSTSDAGYRDMRRPPVLRVSLPCRTPCRAAIHQ